MADGNPVRSVKQERPRHSAWPRAGLKKNTCVRPYTRFERDCIYRFRSIDPDFRPFRVT